MSHDTERARALSRLDEAVYAREPFIAVLFDRLRMMSRDGRGVTRASYMEGEQAAHDEIARLARDLGLAVTTDAAGNLYARLRGADPDLPAWFTGSHLDSVHCGGNFDGAAGVVAGLAAIASMIEAGLRPERDIVLAAFRAEECSTWFVGRHGGHLGSRAALGLLWPNELDTARHITTGLSFGEMVDRAGFDSSALGPGREQIDPTMVAGFVELHIEQGPILHHRAIPVGIVTGIRGAYRCRNAAAVGAYSHSGAVPHELRQDAVLAAAELLMSLDAAWSRSRTAGGDLVVTAGKFCTNPELHSIVKVPGEVAFGIDIRSQDRDVLDAMEALLRTEASRIAAARRVTFTLDPLDRVSPARMDDGLVAALRDDAEALAIPSLVLASGGGHDAADFADAGVPSAMIFVRNDRGSHNPDEAMEIEDHLEGTRLLARFLAGQAGTIPAI